MSLRPDRIKRELARNHVAAFSKFYTGKKSITPNVMNEIASENVFFVTLKSDEHRARALKAQTFAPRPGFQPAIDPRPYTDVDFEFTELNHIMNEMNRRIYGSKWDRDPARRAQLPLAFFYVDFDGSRYCREAPALRDIKGIHLHGLIGFPNSHVERAREVLEARNGLPVLIKEITAKRPLLFNHYRIEPFDPAKVTSGRSKISAFENAVQYAAKGAAHLMASDGWGSVPWRQYPHPSGATYGYPSPPIGSADRRVPFELLEIERQ